MASAATFAAAARRVKTQGLHDGDILDARLAPDMLPFSGQIQRASDKAKNGVARLANIDAPSFTDSEATLAELESRVAKTVEFLTSVSPSRFEGADHRRVELRFRSVNGIIEGHAYLTQILMPDFYFHIATAHGILRSKGLAIGKADYLGKPDYL